VNKYLYKRILLILPTLVIISIIGFLLSRNVPQDPATAVINMRGGENAIGDRNNYIKVYKHLGLDKPNFYFSIVPNTYPKTLNIVSSKKQRKLIKKILARGVPYSVISRLLSLEDNDFDIQKKLTALLENPSKSSTTFFYPKLYWHGSDNQYHRWWSSLLSGSFGKSIVNGQEATTVVKKALTWTAFIALGALIFTFGIGIIVGLWLAQHSDSKASEVTSTILYLLYAIPLFWISTMMVIYFTTDDYGSWTNIFPSAGIEVLPGKSTFAQVLANAHKFILPIFCGSLATIAYIARMVRKSILNELSLPYIVTAYSKGLNSREVLLKHAFPNALLPLLTILVGAIPATLGGSVVLEVIFNIPGVGRLLYNSIGAADWNVVFCILMVTGLITIISYLIGDILYAYFNPKIRLA